MNSLRTTILAAAVTGAVLAPAAVAQAAPTTLAVEQAPTRVAAWNDTVVWSHFDSATRTYSLVKSVNGGPPTAVGIEPRGGSPFDVDLGSSRSGATTAVYTRDGDIYRLNLASGAEVKVQGLSSPVLAERDPTIQRGQIAFIRRNGGRDELRLGATSRRSKLLVRKRSIVSAELGARHIAYVESVPSGFRALHLRVRNLSTGADRLVYKATSGGANAAGVTRPSYMSDPEGFMWARTNNGSGRGNRLIRYTLRGSKLSYAQGSPFYNATAWVNPTLGAVTASSLTGEESQGACTDTGVQYCKVELTGAPRFNLRP